MSIYKNGQKVLGSFNDVTGFIEKDNLETELNKVDRNMKTYTEISQLGLSYPCTTGDVFNALPNNSMINLPVRSLTTSITDAPEGYGVMTIIKYNKEYFNIIFKRSSDNSVASNDIWIGQLKGSDGSDIVWKRLCGTSVADVPRTNVDLNLPFSGTIYQNLSYIVKNGYCTVNIGFGTTSPINSFNFTVVAENLPKPDSGSIVFNILNQATSEILPFYTCLNYDRTLSIKLNSTLSAGTSCIGCLTYLVAES